ncbi:MAG: RagB/SusD family nutrient uptake outer membrane protein, partial [Gemmatimonadetes bacterium]|nr:RagB/SusD family nutrient uptake outer membrane protein [Gemmatimonadota bacterium]
MSMTRNWHRLVALAVLVPLAACSDVLSLNVEAPGRIADTDLNNQDAIPGIVAGMSYDLTTSVNGSIEEILLAGGEIGHGGSYDFGAIPMGTFTHVPEDWNGEYADMSQARWTAEAGLRRIADILDATQFEKNGDVARAYLLAGLSNRWMGEAQCRTTVDGGSDVAHTENFARADSLFTRAIAVGTAAGRTDIVNAAYGGRASVRAWMGQWTAAAADAAQVPTDFVYYAIFSVALQNDLQYETNDRREFSLYNTMWDTVTNDPRVPWDIPVDSNGDPLKGQDGQTIFYHQLKYTDPGDDIPLTHGTEMRVLQAEAALRQGDYAGAETYLNQARAHWSMAPLTLSTVPAEAWATLRFERYATTWLEGRRLWDMRRWKVEGAPMEDPFVQGRDVCFPISRNEQLSNPNVKDLWGGCPTCGS